MTNALKLVADNPQPGRHERLSAHGLHRLADQFLRDIRAGRVAKARGIAFELHLPPIGIAAIATWMTRAGASEAEILSVVAG